MLSSSLLLNWLCLYLVAVLTFKGLGATEISVETWDAWVPLPILALVFITWYLLPLVVVPVFAKHFEIL